jgi:hypothetical protein
MQAPWAYACMGNISVWVTCRFWSAAGQHVLSCHSNLVAKSLTVLSGSRRCIVGIKLSWTTIAYVRCCCEANNILGPF